MNGRFISGNQFPMRPVYGVSAAVYPPDVSSGTAIEVLQALMQPFPFLLLAFPSTIKEVSLRATWTGGGAEPVVVLQLTGAHAIRNRSSTAYRRTPDGPERIGMRDTSAAPDAGLFSRSGLARRIRNRWDRPRQQSDGSRAKRVNAGRRNVSRGWNSVSMEKKPSKFVPRVGRIGQKNPRIFRAAKNSSNPPRLQRFPATGNFARPSADLL